eukprot:4816575-Prymnesium_polylepis.1
MLRAPLGALPPQLASTVSEASPVVVKEVKKVKKRRKSLAPLPARSASPTSKALASGVDAEEDGVVVLGRSPPPSSAQPEVPLEEIMQL